MKNTVTCIACITLFAAAAQAAPQDFMGSFQGNEKSTVTNCGSYNGTTTGPWSVTNSDLSGSSFVGKGHDPNGQFTAKGKVSGSTASGTLKGVNKWGQAWSGQFTATLDGDKYSANTSGSVPSTRCKFSTVVKAARH